MQKMMCIIFTFVGLSISANPVNQNDIWVQAECKTQEILSQQPIKPEFYSLSPELVKAIGKAFFYQQTAAPQLLQDGAYYEFGLYKGFSFWFAERVSRQLRGDKFFFYGFDSFEGLPTSMVDIGGWSPGQYACSIEDVQAYLHEYRADFNKITLIKGWYSKELFAASSAQYAFLSAAIVVIDSDIYESCCSVLEFIADKLRPGTIILFDDFNVFSCSPNQGERRALREFMEKNSTFTILPLFSFGWHGEGFVVKSL